MHPPYFTPCAAEGLYGLIQPKRKTIEEVAERTVRSHQASIKTMLYTPQELYACALFGYVTKGDDRHPLGCHALQEPRCIMQKSGISQAHFANCGVYQIARRITNIEDIEP